MKVAGHSRRLRPFGAILMLSVLAGIHAHRWSPSIRHRLADELAASDTVELVRVVGAAWDRFCVMHPYDDMGEMRREISGEIPWRASVALNDSHNVLLFVDGRRLVAWDRIDRAAVDIAPMPRRCLPRGNARLTIGETPWRSSALVPAGD